MGLATVSILDVRDAIDCERCRRFVELCGADGLSDVQVYEGVTADLETPGHYRASSYFGDGEKCAECGREVLVIQRGRLECCELRLDRPLYRRGGT